MSHLLPFLISSLAFAQTQPAEKVARTPLARFVPSSAEVFVNIPNPSELETALRKVGAPGLLAPLLGQDGGGESASAFRAWLGALVGGEYPAAVEGLMQTELGMVGRSWSDLPQGVLLARLPSEEALAKWLPEDRRQDTRKTGSEALIRTKGGMMVAVRDGVAAFAQRRGDGTVIRDTLRLVSGGDGATLDGDAALRELSSHLSAKPLGVIQLASASGEGDASASWFGWPAQRRTVLGCYAREQRLDVSIRGILAKPAPRRALGTSALERFYQLPATTLAAWISSADLRLTYDQVLQESTDSAVGRYLLLVESMRAATGRGWDSLPPLGPHLIVVWDEDLEGDSAAPHFALLVESPRAQSVVDELDDIVESLVPPSDDGDSPLVSTSHLGTRLRHIPLASFVPDDSLPLALTLSKIELSWTAQGDWVMLALSRDHLRRLLDAQSGLVPRLSHLSDVQLLRRRSNPTSLLMVQPDLAADVVRRGLSKSTGAGGSWFGEGWWKDVLGGEGGGENRLGVAVRTEQIPGVVVVADVRPDTPATGKLEPEDWIIGVDGQLLDLNAPNADLRKRWSAPSPDGRHTLRVLRGDSVQDMSLEVPKEHAAKSGWFHRPTDALADIAAWGRSIRFASWTVHTTDADHYSALVSLRFSEGDAK